MWLTKNRIPIRSKQLKYCNYAYDTILIAENEDDQPVEQIMQFK